MKCKGRLKDKKKSRSKKASLCRAEIDEHAIFCPVCGTPTEALKTALSAKRVFQQEWKAQRQAGFSFSVTGIILMVITLALLYSVFFLTAEMYYITNLILLFIVPFLIVPFSFSWEKADLKLGLKKYLGSLKHYPLSWLFVLMSVLYYFLLKVICTGYLLTVATDPILHLVRLILVIYWLAVIFPAPYLVFRKKINLFQAIKLSYDAGAETRWQHFYLILFIIVMNLIAIIPLGLGLIFTLPLSFRMLNRYYLNMEEYELFQLGRA